MRIVGVDIPDYKRIEAALPYLYGIGRSNVHKILSQANVDGNKRTKDLSEEEVNRIQKALETYATEGELRRLVQQNIARLKEIGSYRGSRHLKNLPARGQRTKTNARTKRGKRVTIGTVRKEVTAKTGGVRVQSAAPAATGKKS